MDDMNTIHKPIIGYCPGTFDLFHIGHLNLLKKSKEKCDYLIAGIATDEFCAVYKGTIPYIPFEERIAIVKAIDFVDEVIAVDKNLSDKINSWKQLKYNIHFSGSDHSDAWRHEISYLEKYGVKFLFFDYTLSTSSTRIKQIIKRDILLEYTFREITNKQIVLWGVGTTFNKYMDRYGEKYRPRFIVDNNQSLWGTTIRGITVRAPECLLEIEKNNLWVIICMDYYPDVAKQLREMGIEKFRIFADYPELSIDALKL